MKQVIGHVYSNTKEQLREIVDKLGKDYEIAYDNEQMTSISVIKEVANDEE